jgi:pimeloyl-ACP methyl ester carboxylesterase
VTTAKPVEREFTAADGVPLVARLLGDAAGAPLAVLLVHGWARSAGYWDEIATVLSGAYPVIAPALRMHEESLLRRPVAVDVSIPLLVDDLAGLLDELGVARCIAIGHSMGGQVVTLLADRFPDRVAATVVLDPAYGAQPDEIAAWPVRRREHVAEARRAFRQRHPDADDDLEQAYAAALEALYDSEYLEDHSIGAIDDTRPVLRRRSRPALAVFATPAGAATERDATADAAVRPDIVLWEAGGGHDFPAHHPEAVSRLILDWLGGQPAVAGAARGSRNTAST